MRHNRRLRWAAIPIAATLVVALAGCTQAQLHGFLPGFVEGEPPVTNHTDRISGLWVTSWIVLLIVGIVVWGLTLWAVIVYRRRKGQTGLPVQLRYNMPIEIFYTIVPLILVLGFFAFTARDQNAIEQPYANPDVKIQVYAKQWAWDFNYVSDNVYDPGIQVQPDDNSATPGSVQEGEVPTLYLPENKKITIQLDSRDVIHSFWVPAMLYKKDVIPGKTNYMYFETTDRTGTFVGKCAELCGEYHSAMLFNVKIVPQSEYDAHIKSLRAQGYEGQLGSEYDRNQNLPGTGAPQGNE
ncbi:cytochrome c oxidase subunit 2 [Leifsonia sp. 98AMF]|uniref:aa3-type cytochrome oxidase subunit II n=1 Tax=Microbacteriaceae TaxID=85023 RepID=UPI00038157AE|nr:MULTISPECIES: cytochrome c oxidase subunit II [Microbacteriaceae]TDP99743.1 cytochrome c oxidase subunit 2 [Leifsonia sp. 115AMFTsu3.1]SDH42558.1 cytochrome c oxidase subunit 2 [Leifsonia sp. 197AMF]SDI94450.1 cytochrome c oxidase subunit 2 [Leifsonia sp. 466MF]SDJ83039.1 cytochrome c oxidase subunit 2 [Leifsonia sp. 157MF]SDN98117.1 cytochrome c oxidase subunit 2 [Leifsonia sp. 509MF]